MYVVEQEARVYIKKVLIKKILLRKYVIDYTVGTTIMGIARYANMHT